MSEEHDGLVMFQIFDEPQFECPRCKSFNYDLRADELTDGGGNFAGWCVDGYCHDCQYEWIEPPDDGE